MRTECLKWYWNENLLYCKKHGKRNERTEKNTAGRIYKNVKYAIPWSLFPWGKLWWKFDFFSSSRNVNFNDFSRGRQITLIWKKVMNKFLSVLIERVSSVIRFFIDHKKKLIWVSLQEHFSFGELQSKFPLEINQKSPPRRLGVSRNPQNRNNHR